MLFLVFGFSIAGVALLEVWSRIARTHQETEIRWIEDQFRAAIASYRDGAPGPVKKWPGSFDELLEDRRLPVTRRHLRRVYDNPRTGSADWNIERAPDGGFGEIRAK